MKYIEGFRDPAAAARLREQIATQGGLLDEQGRRASIMEVCGTHTMAIARYGIHAILPKNVRLISGPGCPVCVTDPGYIDAAIALAERSIAIVTFGDLLNVPGSESSLSRCRSQGGRIHVGYSPTAALQMAVDEPQQEFIFLAVGFETTIAPIVSMLDSALRRGIRNLSLLTAFKLVPPALKALLADPEVKIDAFLCPAHVSAIIGTTAYEPFTGTGGVPCVIAGFEPLDILLGLRNILSQLVRREAKVENEYSRVVRPDGNPKARQLMAQYLQPIDAAWRGIGTIPGSGAGLRPDFSAYDAEVRHDLRIQRGREAPGCACGEIIKGKRLPPECPLFARRCTPEAAVGPCMVSSEGTCAAWYRYARMTQEEPPT